jgi:hypothetical protein
MEHNSLATTQLHFDVEHGCAEALPHLISFDTSVGAGDTAGGNVTGIRIPDTSSMDRPYSPGLKVGGSAFNADFHMAV